MSITQGYIQQAGGFYKTSDGSGPYSIASDGTATLIGSGGGAGGGGGGGTPENPMVIDWYGFPGLSSENTPIQVMPMYNTGGNLPNVTVAGGSGWTTLPQQAASKLVIANVSGVDLEYKQTGDGTMPLLDGKETEVLGISDCNQISVRRADGSAEDVTLHVRWLLA